jgi:hypothetical protein
MTPLCKTSYYLLCPIKDLLPWLRPFLKISYCCIPEPKFIVILWELKPAAAWGSSQLRHGVAHAP